jgi:hypothetical protein
MRDLVNVIDKATWAEFGLYAAALWVLALVVGPLVFWLASFVGAWSCQKSENHVPNGTPDRFSIFSATTGQVFRKTIPALLPLGLALWAAFFVATLMANFTFVLLTFSDPFGWGWDLLGTAGMPWLQLWPSGVPWIQAGLTLSGLAFSLQKGYDLWKHLVAEKELALRGFAPTAAVLITVTAGMLLYFTNY